MIMIYVVATNKIFIIICKYLYLSIFIGNAHTITNIIGVYFGSIPFNVHSKLLFIFK